MIHKFKKWLINILFPAFCIGCKQEGCFLCPDCIEHIPKLDKQRCPFCSLINPNGKVCGTCSGQQHFLDGVIVYSRFEEHSLLQRAIHQLKYDFIHDLAYPLGTMLFDVFSGQLDYIAEHFNHIIFCPLPLHKKRLLWRGFNQSDLLCKNIIQTFTSTVDQNIYPAAEHLNLLYRTRYTRPQMESSREERIKNVIDAFQVDSKNLQAPALSNLNMNNPLGSQQLCVVLVDDIATTLSTLENAAQALKSAGFKHIYALVLARVFNNHDVEQNIDSR